MKTTLLGLLLLCSISFQGFSQNGKLSKAKESLNTSSSSASETLQGSSVATYDDDISNPFTSIFLSIFAYTAYGIAIESPFEYEGRMHSAEIATYPYKKAAYGNFIYATDIDYAIVRLDLTNNFVIENTKLYGNHLTAKFRFLKRMDLTATYLYLHEKTPTATDSFSLYTALLNYHRIRTQKFDLWFGLGTMYVGKDVDKFGFSYGIGAEWFIKKPLSLEASFYTSSINDRNVNTSKVLLKYYFKKYLFSMGYEGFTLGVSNINTLSVGVGATF